MTKIQVYGSTVLKKLDSQLEEEDKKGADQNIPTPSVGDVLGEFFDAENVFILDPMLYLLKQQIDVKVINLFAQGVSGFDVFLFYVPHGGCDYS